MTVMSLLTCYFRNILKHTYTHTSNYRNYIITVYDSVWSSKRRCAGWFTLVVFLFVNTYLPILSCIVIQVCLLSTYIIYICPYWIFSSIHGRSLPKTLNPNYIQLERLQRKWIFEQFILLKCLHKSTVQSCCRLHNLAIENVNKNMTIDRKNYGDFIL